MALIHRSSNLLRRLSTVVSSTPSLHRRFSSATATITITITAETNVPFTAYNCDPPSRTVETTPKELLSFFRNITMMRQVEMAADSLYKADLVRGFCHLYDGQEAVAVGMEAAFTKKDCIITAYRVHCPSKATAEH